MIEKVLGGQSETAERRTAVAKFPLRLMPSIRKSAEAFSAKEGVSLNQFINIAVAEKLVHLQHEDWARNRQEPSRELAARALRLLDKAGNKAVEPGDELP
jgi:hypothetical protein